MPGLLLPPVQYGAPSTSYQDDESLCSSRQGLIRSQRSSTVSSTTAEERTALKSSSEDAYQDAKHLTIRLSKRLLFSLILFLLLVLSSILTATILYILSPTTCTSPICVAAAEKIRTKSAVATTSNIPSPCDDFYEYACAGWAESTIVRAPRSPDWNVALDTSFHSFERIRKLFGRLMLNAAAENLTTYQTGALVTYKKCMMESVEDAQAALQIAYNEMNGWLSTSFDTNSIEKTLVGGYRSNAVSLFHINAMIDAQDMHAHTVLTIEEAVPYTGRIGLYAPMESFDVEDLVAGRLEKHWLHYLLLNAGTELGHSLGMTINAQFKTALARAIQLDYEISRCSPVLFGETPQQWRITLAELAQYSDMFDFHHFLSEFLGRDLSATTQIVVAPGRAYFDRMMKVLAKYSTQEGLNTIRDYIKFKQLFLLSVHSGKLTQSKDLGGLETLRILYTGEDDQNFQCINRVGMTNQLGFVSLLERFWAPQLRENMDAARKIGEAMRTVYVEQLRKSAVIDDIDRAAMIEKAERIRIRVAVPEAARDAHALLQESQMFVNDTNYPWSLFFTLTMGNKHWKQMSNYGKPVNQDEWPSDTNTFNTNVYYNYESNSILFPIIWSAEQFLDASLPSLFSYAGFGSIVGHEMTHAFDYKGRNFGPSGVDGNLTQGETTKNFQAKQQCFLEQYTALGEARITEDILAENLADNAALGLTYKAWKSQDDLRKQRLPGIQMTSEQAFFTAYAQNWCSLAKTADGTHSMGKLRVLGPLQNSRAFADAFSCPAGSFMNPTKKCSLW